jgi:hypothetical protein
MDEANPVEWHPRDQKIPCSMSSSVPKPEPNMRKINCHAKYEETGEIAS